ncbi:MAG: hypothetical protein V3T14_02335 [Myxococcota bacterium]
MGEGLERRGLLADGRAEGVDDAAATGLLMLLARLQRCPKNALDVAEFLHPRRDRFQAVLDQLLNSPAACRPEQLGDVPERESRRLGGSDEAEPMNVFLRVEAVVRGGAASGLQDALPLLVPHGRGRDACRLCQLTDREEPSHASSLKDIERRFKVGW